MSNKYYLRLRAGFSPDREQLLHGGYVGLQGNFAYIINPIYFTVEDVFADRRVPLKAMNNNFKMVQGS